MSMDDGWMNGEEPCLHTAGLLCRRFLYACATEQQQQQQHRCVNNLTRRGGAEKGKEEHKDRSLCWHRLVGPCVLKGKTMRCNAMRHDTTRQRVKEAVRRSHTHPPNDESRSVFMNTKKGGENPMT